MHIHITKQLGYYNRKDSKYYRAYAKLRDIDLVSDGTSAKSALSALITKLSARTYWLNAAKDEKQIADLNNMIDIINNYIREHLTDNCNCCHSLIKHIKEAKKDRWGTGYICLNCFNEESMIKL